MNLLDKAIRTIAPGWALSRQRARSVLAFHDQWNSASTSRPAFSNWNPSGADADTDLAYTLPRMRRRSHDMYRNAPLAGAAINTMGSHVIGTGLSLQSAIDGAELGWSETQTDAWKKTLMRRWLLWAESITAGCDITRSQDFYGLQDLAFRSMLLSGDVFALLTKDQAPDGRELPAVQLIEADRVSNENNKPDAPRLVSGIQTTRTGAPLAYHICRQHPGSSMAWRSGAMKWDVVPAYGKEGQRNVIHLFERMRPGQTRGVPILAPVMEPLKQLQRYTEAELQAAVISGAFAVFIKMEPAAFHDLFGEGPSRQSYLDAAMKWDGGFPSVSMDGPGKAVNLLPGESVEPSNPGRPNSEFDPFVQAIVRQIGARLGLPFEVLVKHFTSSYSASRAALLDAWRVFRVRRDFMATRFCQPIFEEWLAWEVSGGTIHAPGFFTSPDLRAVYCAANWVGDGPGSIDPEKEVKAATARVQLGISTLAAESIQHDGGDWETKHAQRTKESAMRRAAGLEDPAPPQSSQDPGVPEP